MATAKVEGLEETLVLLDEVEARAQDLTPALEVVAQDMVLMLDDAFDTSTSPMGEPWAPLSQATIDRKKSSRPLIDTQTLRNSINAQVVSPTAITFGTNVPYAAFHQFGTRRIPRRSFLPVILANGRFVFANTGPAAVFLAEARELLRRYVADGVIE